MEDMKTAQHHLEEVSTVLWKRLIAGATFKHKENFDCIYYIGRKEAVHDLLFTLNGHSNAAEAVKNAVQENYKYICFYV